VNRYYVKLPEVAQVYLFLKQDQVTGKSQELSDVTLPINQWGKIVRNATCKLHKKYLEINTIYTLIDNFI